MLIITKLSFQKRDPTRVNIFIDGKYTFSLSAEQVISRGLKKSQEISPIELQQLDALSNEEKVFARIYNYLSYRPRSTREVKDRLNQYLGKESPELKDLLIAKLTKLGYLDDEKFALWFIESRRTHRPRSRRQLVSELIAKGIPRVIIDQILTDPSADREALKRLINNKSSLDKPHLLAYLARKGFSYSLIKEELDKIGFEE
ncbi:MAG: RecX family transcriptional regulator [bacterium]